MLSLLTRPLLTRHRRLLLYGGLIFGLALLALPPFVLWRLNQPTLAPERQVRITRGMTADHIGRTLAEAGLIRHAGLFALIARLQGLGNQLEAGTYWLDGQVTTAQILQRLRKAPLHTRRVTLPEGWTLGQVAGALQAQGLADSSRLRAVATDPAFITGLGLDAPSLEGYLFPETYLFDVETTEEALLTRMVDQFRRVFDGGYRQRLEQLDMSLHEAVTLASIVEREALAAAERPLIAAVFHRRLRLSRRLESCATVEYALGYHKPRLTYDDLKVNSPYNTYIYPGLPPGPIGNPGRAALEAALYPDETEYLYFVARGDGTHIFSRTNAEHNAAKRRIRREGGGRIN